MLTLRQGSTSETAAEIVCDPGRPARHWQPVPGSPLSFHVTASDSAPWHAKCGSSHTDRSRVSVVVGLTVTDIISWSEY
jgi:hypothetical protein